MCYFVPEQILLFADIGSNLNATPSSVVSKSHCIDAPAKPNSIGCYTQMPGPHTAETVYYDRFDMGPIGPGRTYVIVDEVREMCIAVIVSRTFGVALNET
jgi:hypothetical protein